MEAIGLFGSIIVPQIPMFLVWMFGIILAIARWQRHPRVSALTVGVLLGMILLAMLGAIAAMIPFWAAQADWEPARTAWFVGGINLALRLIETGLWVGVVSAIFGWRRPAKVVKL
jgi:hypothetical protein